MVPLAGKDQRFVEEFGIIKPLVKVRGKPIIQWCMELLPFDISKTIFLCLQEDQQHYHIADRLLKLFDGVDVVLQDKLTEGATPTVLNIKDTIDNQEDLLIYLADIYFDANFQRVIEQRHPNSAGIIPVFLSDNPKYSYTELNDDSTVKRVAEKQVISQYASAGCYYFTHGADFVWAAQEMVKKDKRVNNLFYICPVYNELLERGDRVDILRARFRFGLGSPEEVRVFETL